MIYITNNPTGEYMHYPFENEGDELPLIQTMQAIQETVVENIYNFLEEVWPFAVNEEDDGMFI